MIAEIDRPNRIPWPPILYAAVLAAAIALEWLWPLRAPSSDVYLRAAGGVVFLLGLAFAVAGIIQFRITGTPVDPTAKATALVTVGPYRFSRNPMYAGIVVALAGLGVAIGSWWLILLDATLPFLLYALAIRREEAFLERVFGETYRNYKAQSGRWFGPF